MKSMHTFLTALALLVHGAHALSINNPTSAVVCQPLLLTWTGGTAPYFLSIIEGAAPESALLVDLGQQTGTSFTWIVNIDAGTSVGVSMHDSTGSVAQSAPFPINSGADSSCVGKPVITTVGTSTTQSSTSTVGSTTTQSSTSTAGTTQTSASSVTTRTLDTTVTGSVARPATTTVTASSHKAAPVGAIVGGTIGGIAIILATIISFYCWRRTDRNRPLSAIEPGTDVPSSWNHYSDIPPTQVGGMAVGTQVALGPNNAHEYGSDFRGTAFHHGQEDSSRQYLRPQLAPQAASPQTQQPAPRLLSTRSTTVKQNSDLQPGNATHKDTTPQERQAPSSVTNQSTSSQPPGTAELSTSAPMPSESIIPQLQAEIAELRSEVRQLRPSSQIPEHHATNSPALSSGEAPPPYIPM